MNKVVKSALTVSMALGLAFAGLACGSGAGKAVAYKDGSYTGTFTSEGKHPSTFDVNLTIKEGKITEVTATEKGEDGKIKDEHYGEGGTPETYKMAQDSVAGFKQYPAMLIEKQDVDAMDAVTGATNSFKGFKAAVQDALSKAK